MFCVEPATSGSAVWFVVDVVAVEDPELSLAEGSAVWIVGESFVVEVVDSDDECDDGDGDRDGDECFVTEESEGFGLLGPLFAGVRRVMLFGFELLISKGVQSVGTSCDFVFELTAVW